MSRKPAATPEKSIETLKEEVTTKIEKPAEWLKAIKAYYNAIATSKNSKLKAIQKFTLVYETLEASLILASTQIKKDKTYIDFCAKTVEFIDSFTSKIKGKHLAGVKQSFENYKSKCKAIKRKPNLALRMLRINNKTELLDDGFILAHSVNDPWITGSKAQWYMRQYGIIDQHRQELQLNTFAVAETLFEIPLIQQGGKAALPGEEHLFKLRFNKVLFQSCQFRLPAIKMMGKYYRAVPGGSIEEKDTYHEIEYIKTDRAEFNRINQLNDFLNILYQNKLDGLESLLEEYITHDTDNQTFLTETYELFSQAAVYAAYGVFETAEDYVTFCKKCVVHLHAVTKTYLSEENSEIYTKILSLLALMDKVKITDDNQTLSVITDAHAISAVEPSMSEHYELGPTFIHYSEKSNAELKLQYGRKNSEIEEAADVTPFKLKTFKIIFSVKPNCEDTYEVSMPNIKDDEDQPGMLSFINTSDTYSNLALYQIITEVDNDSALRIFHAKRYNKDEMLVEPNKQKAAQKAKNLPQFKPAKQEEGQAQKTYEAVASQIDADTQDPSDIYDTLVNIIEMSAFTIEYYDEYIVFCKSMYELITETIKKIIIAQSSDDDLEPLEALAINIAHITRIEDSRNLTVFLTPETSLALKKTYTQLIFWDVDKRKNRSFTCFIPTAETIVDEPSAAECFPAYKVYTNVNGRFKNKGQVTADIHLDYIARKSYLTADGVQFSYAACEVTTDDNLLCENITCRYTRPIAEQMNPGERRELAAAAATFKQAKSASKAKAPTKGSSVLDKSIEASKKEFRQTLNTSFKGWNASITEAISTHEDPATKIAIAYNLVIMTLDEAQGLKTIKNYQAFIVVFNGWYEQTVAPLSEEENLSEISMKQLNVLKITNEKLTTDSGTLVTVNKRSPEEEPETMCFESGDGEIIYFNFSNNEALEDIALLTTYQANIKAPGIITNDAAMPAFQEDGSIIISVRNGYIIQRLIKINDSDKEILSIMALNSLSTTKAPLTPAEDQVAIISAAFQADENSWTNIRYVPSIAGPIIEVQATIKKPLKRKTKNGKSVNTFVTTDSEAAKKAAAELEAKLKQEKAKQDAKEKKRADIREKQKTKKLAEAEATRQAALEKKAKEEAEYKAEKAEKEARQQALKEERDAIQPLLSQAASDQAKEAAADTKAAEARKLKKQKNQDKKNLKRLNKKNAAAAAAKAEADADAQPDTAIPTSAPLKSTQNTVILTTSGSLPHIKPKKQKGPAPDIKNHKEFPVITSSVEDDLATALDQEQTNPDTTSYNSDSSNEAQAIPASPATNEDQVVELDESTRILQPSEARHSYSGPGPMLFQPPPILVDLTKAQVTTSTGVLAICNRDPRTGALTDSYGQQVHLNEEGFAFFSAVPPMYRNPETGEMMITIPEAAGNQLPPRNQ